MAKQRTKGNPRSMEEQTTQDTGSKFEPRPQWWKAKVVPIVLSQLSITDIFDLHRLVVYLFVCFLDKH